MKQSQAITYHRRIEIAGIELFYREAGPADGPVVVLLHGFPSSSHMYRRLLPALAGHYRVIAPDLPGFGLSEMPPRDAFDYTFAHFAEITGALLDALGANSYALYVMDYGAPTGLRLAMDHPEKVSALIVQNGNAYEVGLQEFWQQTRAYWENGSQASREALRPFLTAEGTRFQYYSGVTDTERLDPAAWLHDQLFLDRPGAVEIQLDIIYDYRSNVALYPQFQAYFREHRPPALVVWGRNDPIFPVAAAQAYLDDLPEAELHLFDTGHFALEDKADEIVPVLQEFLDRTLLV